MSLFDSLQPGSQFLAGNRRLFAVCLLLFLISASLSFWLFFPGEVLQRYLIQEISRQSGLQVAGGDTEMLLPLGLQLDLEVDSGVAELENPIRLEQLRLTPAWASLFSGAAAANMKAMVAEGTVAGRLDRKGRLELDFSSIELFGLQQAKLPYRLQGRLNGSLLIEDLAAALDGQGEFSLQLQNSVLHGLDRIGLPGRLSLGTVQLDGKFYQQRLSVEKLVMMQGAVEVSGGGTLLLADTAERARLNLNFRLHPSQSTPESLRDMLEISGVKPTTDGSYLLRVGGTLARPVLR